MKKIEITYNESSPFSHNIKLARSSQGKFNKRADIYFHKADMPWNIPRASRGKRNLIYVPRLVENSIAVGEAGCHKVVPHTCLEVCGQS